MNLKEWKIIFKHFREKGATQFISNCFYDGSKNLFSLNNCQKKSHWNCAMNLWHFMSTAVVECRSLSHEVQRSFYFVAPELKFSGSNMKPERYDESKPQIIWGNLLIAWAKKKKITILRWNQNKTNLGYCFQRYNAVHRCLDRSELKRALVLNDVFPCLSACYATRLQIFQPFIMSLNNAFHFQTKSIVYWISCFRYLFLVSLKMWSRKHPQFCQYLWDDRNCRNDHEESSIKTYNFLAHHENLMILKWWWN